MSAATPALRRCSAQGIGCASTIPRLPGPKPGETFGREFPEVVLESADPEGTLAEQLTATAAFNTESPSASIPRMAERLGVSKTAYCRQFSDELELLFLCYPRGGCGA